MVIVPKVKCSQCDRVFSRLKHKCPYCGAGRSRSGRWLANATDPVARLLIRGLLLLAMMVTVISMIAIGLNSNGPEVINAPPVEDPYIQNGDGYENGAETPDPTPPPPPPEPEVSVIPITSVSITWRFQIGDANDVTLPIGDALEVWADIFPADADVEVRWAVDNPNVANFTVNPDDLTRIEIEARSSGIATITVTAGHLTADLIVRV